MGACPFHLYPKSVLIIQLVIRCCQWAMDDVGSVGGVCRASGRRPCPSYMPDRRCGFQQILTRAASRSSLLRYLTRLDVERPFLTNIRKTLKFPLHRYL